MKGIPGAGKFLKGYVDGDFVAYIENSPEQIAAFIMKNRFASTVITNIYDTTELETLFGSLIMYCANQQFLVEQLHPVLIPMQIGEADVIEFVSYTSDLEEEF